MHLLIESLKTYWKDSRRYYVSGNMFLHYEPFSKKKFKGPDFFLVLDVDTRERKSWVVWQEGYRYPDVIIELLSDSTRKKDRGEKKILYEQTFGTPEYYIYDPFRFEFEGYRLTRKGYKTVLPGKDKKIYSPATGLYLTIKDEWLRWMTKGGYVLPSPVELAEKAIQRADKAAQHAEKATQRAETEKHRADREKHRADKAAQRAEKAAQHAEKATQRAEEAEKLIILERERSERLAAKLKELGISPD
jgi:Uma2 family endonuclease